ncbi:hypothetical protein [Brevundimonas sp.]
MIHRILIGAAALNLMAGASLAQSSELSPASMGDIECLAVMAVITATAEDGSALQMAAVSGTMYYLGRLDGNGQSTDWRPVFTAYLQSPDIDKTLEPHHERCRQELAEKGATLRLFGLMITTKAAAAD